MLSTLAIAGSGCSVVATDQNPEIARAGMESSVNLPVNSKILLFIGQDNETINDYTSEVQSPLTGFTLYTSIGGDLNGVENEIDMGAGRIYFRELLVKHPNAALSIGVWMGNTIRQERAFFSNKKKNYIRVIKKLIAMAQENELMKHRQIFLRLAYEFDASWNGYNSEDVKEAFIIAKKLIKKAGATNIALVWQSASYPALEYSDKKLEGMYPGDEYVDWVGISVFNLDPAYEKLWACADPVLKEKTPSEIYNLHLDFSRRHNKPVMIAESSPQGFNINEGTYSCLWGGSDPRTEYPRRTEVISAQKLWNLWFKEYFALIYANSDVIRAAAYINTNWNEQYMWACKNGHCPVGYWGNARVQDSELIRDNWEKEISRDIWAK